MDTAELIITEAHGLIQSHGYHGFSYQDLADRLGIRKPSIYHHFPSKADLGRAVVARYRAKIGAVATQIKIAGDIEPWSALSLYVAPLAEIGRTPDQACLCAVLGGEYLVLPSAMQDEVAAFYRDQIAFVTELLDRGRRIGAFQFRGEPAAMARLTFAAIEGGMAIKRALDDTSFFDGILATLRQVLGGDGN